MRKIYVLLLFLVYQPLHAQKEVNGKKYGVKLNVNSSFFGENFYFTDTLKRSSKYLNTSRKFYVLPSFFIQNEKQNLWEFHSRLVYFEDADNYTRVDSSNTSVGNNLNNSTYLSGSKYRGFTINLGAKNHINLAKNSKKFRAFLSFNYEIGFERLKNSPYEAVAFYRESTFASLKFGMSSRVGYNITDKLFIEITPPIYFDIFTRFGKQYIENPFLPEFQRRGKLIALNYEVMLFHLARKFKGLYAPRSYQIANGIYSDILSIGYTF